MGQFVIDLQKVLADRLDADVRTVGGAVLSLQEMVVNGANGLAGTPKDTGKARSNWFVDVDTMQPRVSDDTTTRNLGLAQSAVSTALGKPNPPKVFYLHNSLPYIKHLEYGLYPNPPKNPTGKTVNGYSTQAPQGFFRLSLQRWEAVVKSARSK